MPTRRVLIAVLAAAASLPCAAATPAPRGGATGVEIDTAAQVRPFSPLIFGVAFGDDARFGEIGYPLRRWGGNAVTRYNWQVDVSSTAADWYFENIPGSRDRTNVPPLGNAADGFIAATRAAGADVLLTIPTIGWTPRADSPLDHPYFAGFSVAKYGAQQSTDPWDPDAGNGVRSNGTPVTGNDPADTSEAADPSFQRGWIAHLQAAFGGAAAGGVRYYALDNELMLWNSTQRDVHPQPVTYDEAWQRGFAYAGAIRAQDAAAQVTGPVTWGYCDLFTSADDATRGSCLDGSDRQAHGGLPFVAWYLQQACANPLAGGARVIDWLDLHYYPQGAGVALSDDDSPAIQARRFRSLKELYDPAWVAESWIADLGDFDANHYDKPNLIPRVRAWIDAYCPGIGLAITEYNWGNDGTASGAVAQAELFGIFAREGVGMATRWVAPAPGSRVERAFSLFLDYDGAGGRVQGNSVAAHSADADALGAYAFHDGARTMVLLTNKTAEARNASLHFATAPGTAWTLYGFDAAQPVHVLASGSMGGTELAVTALPPVSASLLVVHAGDAIFADGFD